MPFYPISQNAAITNLCYCWQISQLSDQQRLNKVCVCSVLKKFLFLCLKLKTVAGNKLESLHNLLTDLRSIFSMMLMSVYFPTILLSSLQHC